MKLTLSALAIPHFRVRILALIICGHIFYFCSTDHNLGRTKYIDPLTKKGVAKLAIVLYAYCLKNLKRYNKILDACIDDNNYNHYKSLQYFF